MSRDIKIELDLGDGLKTSNDKLGVDFTENAYLRLDIDPNNPGHNGIHVSNLNGADGAGGKSKYDDWTLIAGTGIKIPKVWSDQEPDFLNINRSVITCIFSMGLYRPSNRQAASDIVYTSEVKNVRAICNEIDAPSRYCAGTYYRPIVGDIIQLVENPSLRYDSGNSSYPGRQFWCESLRREGLDKDNARQKTRVMFIITEINYGASQAWVDSMSLKCIYSDNVSSYAVGQTYSGSADFTSPYV